MTDELDAAPLPGSHSPRPKRWPAPVPGVGGRRGRRRRAVRSGSRPPAPTAAGCRPPRRPPASSKRNRVLGLTAQATGVIGIVLFVALAVVMLLGRGWATSKVDEISGGIDAKMAQAVPCSTLRRPGCPRSTAVSAPCRTPRSPSRTRRGRPRAARRGPGPGRDPAARYIDFRSVQRPPRQGPHGARQPQAHRTGDPGVQRAQGPIDALNTVDGIIRSWTGRSPTPPPRSPTDRPGAGGLGRREGATLQAGLTKLTRPWTPRRPARGAADAGRRHGGHDQAVHLDRIDPAVPAVPVLRLAPLGAVPHRPWAGTRHLTACGRPGGEAHARHRVGCRW